MSAFFSIFTNDPFCVAKNKNDPSVAYFSRWFVFLVFFSLSESMMKSRVFRRAFTFQKNYNVISKKGLLVSCGTETGVRLEEEEEGEAG